MARIKPEYIDMDFEAALELKYQSGLAKHRQKPGDSFTGDPCAELFEELLDGIHYVIEIENSSQGAAAAIAGYRTTLKNLALNLQSRKAELRKRR